MRQDSSQHGSHGDSQGAGEPERILPIRRHGGDELQGIRRVCEGTGWVVVEKPAGMLSVPGKGPDKAGCLAARVRAMYPGARGPLVVHRLDMETSGLMVFGLTVEMQRALSGQFERRQVGKRYVALLAQGAEDGKATSRSKDGADPLAQDSGEVSLPMRLDVQRRPIQIVDFEQGREAVTRWRVLGRERDVVRVEFEPITGRTHQLRVHAAAGLGWPIIGDVLYGGRSGPRLMLHASWLSFVDPGSGERVEVESEAPF